MDKGRNYCDECKGWTLHEIQTGICCKCEWDEGVIILGDDKLGLEDVKE